MFLSIIITYYNQPEVLEWNLFYARKKTIPSGMDAFFGQTEIIIVDDGSMKSPAKPVLESRKFRCPLSLYKVTEDIPWNQCGARNLGATMADGWWLLFLDVDHTFRNEVDFVDTVKFLLTTRSRWVSLKRISIPLHDTLNHGKNIFAMRKPDFFKIGGYDEDLTGEYVQDPLFIANATKCLHESVTVIDHPTLDVLVEGKTRDLPRNSDRNRKLIMEKLSKGDAPKNMIRFPWVRQI